MEEPLRTFLSYAERSAASVSSGNAIPVCFDEKFGPAVGPQCRSGLDLTITFEEIMMGILPATLLLVITPIRLLQLTRTTRNSVVPSPWYLIKLYNVFLLAALKATILIFVITRRSQLYQFMRTTIASSALSLLEALLFVLLSHYEHLRSVRPSSILNIYLTFSLAFDIIRTRTLWTVKPIVTSDSSDLSSEVYVCLFASGILLKLAILFLEAKDKRSYLIPEERDARTLEETSGIFSRSFFSWMNPLIMEGYRKVLRLEDLFHMDAQISSSELHKRFRANWALLNEKSKKSKVALFMVGVKTMPASALYPIVPRLFVTALNFAQPFLIRRMLVYVSPGASSSSLENNSLGMGRLLILAFSMRYVFYAIFSGQYWHGIYRFCTQMRGCLVDIIYLKTLEIGVENVGGGSAVTLMGNDVEKFVDGLKHVFECMASTIQVVGSVYLLYRELGVAFVAPVLWVIICTGVSVFLAESARPEQKKWSEATQTRVDVTSHAISQIRDIKLTGLAREVKNLLMDLRVKDIKQATIIRKIIVMVALFSNICYLGSACLAYGTFALISKYTGSNAVLNNQKLFTSMAILQLMTGPLNGVLQSFASILQGIGCLERIGEYLQLEGREDGRLLRYETEDISERSADASFTPPSIRGVRQSPQHQDIELTAFPVHSNLRNGASSSSGGASLDPSVVVQEAIRIEQADLGWKQPSRGKITANRMPAIEPTLKDINLSIQTNALTFIIGPIGAGKTTLLKSLLGETHALKGFVNIYNPDFCTPAFCDQDPFLTNTSVKTNILGVDLYDATWYREVVGACGLEEDMKIWKKGEHTLVGSRGLTLSGGQKQRIALARAVYSRKKAVYLDDIFSGFDAGTEELVFESLLGRTGLLRRPGYTVVFVTHNVRRLPFADQIVALDLNGRISEIGTFNNLVSRDGYVRSVMAAVSYKSSAPKMERPQPEVAFNTLPEPPLDTGILPTNPRPLNPEEETSAAEEDLRRQVGDMRVYGFYFKSMTYFHAILFTVIAVASVVVLIYQTVWLRDWAESNATSPNTRLGFWLGGLVAITAGYIIILYWALWLYIQRIMPVASKNLHDQQLVTLMKAPMAFFSSSDVGALTNRFSQDLFLVDQQLPNEYLNFVAGTAQLIGQVVLMTLATPLLAATFPFLAFVFYLIQRFYLRTSRQLRLMDLEAKSPLYAHFLESLQGLCTIRAFGWMAEMSDRNKDMLNDSQKPFYLLFAIQQWLQLVLDMVVAGVATILVGLAVGLRSNVNAGYLGIGLIGLMDLSFVLKQVVTQWTQMETSIGAVARIREFVEGVLPELPETDDEANRVVPADEKWPYDGVIDVQNLSAFYRTFINTMYSEDGDPVLKGISLNIRSGEKFAIVGRSGSGKSSFVSTLFCMMATAPDSSIEIDSVPIRMFSPDTLRSRLNAVTQEPFFMKCCTIRKNLDPFGLRTDKEILAALRLVGLLEKILSTDSLPLEEILDKNIDTEEVLSHGQRQLFCLARAILRHRPGGILVLDEATSRVDVATDALMQKIIRSEEAFPESPTIVAVVHRLDTILDFDRVLVLGKGEILEIGNPMALLRSEEGSGKFRELYETYKEKGKGLEI